jgi:hypothetical protein
MIDGNAEVAGNSFDSGNCLAGCQDSVDLSRLVVMASHVFDRPLSSTK